ncbi:MAG TPA: hemerythrin domain-containing protein [Candidatus Xenobia bacterium]|jgi:iron-sulfur cluster repair protein YtfE (RIC family)
MEGKAVNHWQRALDCHAAHAACFAAHQAALLDRDLAAADRLLTTYEADLLSHMAVEERGVLPLYRDRGGERPGGTVDLFLREHDKLRTALRHLRQCLAGLSPAPAAIIDLLDRECAYKNLMAHHDLRERNMLYPWLAEHATAAEAEALVAQL